MYYLFYSKWCPFIKLKIQYDKCSLGFCISRNDGIGDGLNQIAAIKIIKVI
jgi:hypothetical protein